MTWTLITGASGGIGEAIAREFARNDHSLILTARSEDKLQALAEELRAKHKIDVQVIACDLGAPEGVSQLLAECHRRALKPDILVNNAGFANFGSFHEIPIEQHLALIQLNIRALTELTYRLLPMMLARGSGKIVNIASTAAFVPGPLMAVYYASKAYVLSFSDAIAEEVTTSGVTVTCVCPGPTTSGFQKRADMGKSRLMQGKMMTSEEVARATLIGTLDADRLVIPGWQNKVTVFMSRFAPRALLAKVVLGAQEPV